MTQLLIIEDESALLDSVRRGLEAEGYDVLGAETGEEGRLLCHSSQIDVVILDLMLPDDDGLELLKNLRGNGFRQPVLIISARDTVDQRIAGLNSGADDYLIKPFAFSELLARVRAILRRRADSADITMICEDIVLDPVTRSVSRAGRPIELTPRQFDVLAYLISHKNQVVSRDAGYQHIAEKKTAGFLKQTNRSPN